MRYDRAAETDLQRSPLRVLFFEDCDEDIELCLRTLKSAGFDVTWDQAVTPEEVIERQRAATYDVILSDYRMPCATGMDVYGLMQSEGIQTPFILLTGSLGDEMAVECLKQGVADYVLKDRMARLPIVIRRAREEERGKRERARMVEALRASEASYRSLIQSAPCGILRLSAADGRLLDANAALAAMLGYDSAADLVKDSAGGGITLCQEILSDLKKGSGVGQTVECEVQWKRQDGEQILIRLCGRLLRNEDGAPACLEMIGENVTERNSAKQRIEQLNRLYSVLTHANQAIVRTPDSRALFQAICRIIVEEGGFQMAWLGIVEPGTDEITPHGSFPVQDPYFDGIRISATAKPEGCGPVGRAIRENRYVICNDIAGDPSMAPWRDRALRRSFGSLAAFPIVNHERSIGVLTIYAAEANAFDIEIIALLAELASDVSFAIENIETERRHRHVAAELDQFFALSLDMLCIADLEGNFQRLNPAWEKTLGFTAAEMCSRPWIEFVHPDDRRQAMDALACLSSGAEVRHLELRFRSRTGAYKWLVGTATPSLERRVVFAAVSDITDRKCLEEQLRLQNLELEERNRSVEAASRMKSEFLANMSHELRSPLNGIIGFSELLYDGKFGALAERPREFVGRIHASASHLLQLINGVLDLSKIEAGHLEFRPERLSVSSLVQEVTGILSAVAAEKQIRIESDIDQFAEEVSADAGRLRQVLYNYLSNAVKFTGEGGRVMVRLKSEGDDEFRLEVSDTGIGIAKDDMGRLFVEFQQLDNTTSKRYQGTGLGLALTKRIVEAQGGRVGVVSRPGEGSTFFAVLPRRPLTSPLQRKASKILVIDDQKVDRLLLSRILKSNGYAVETAATGEEAYGKCRRERFDAITLDLVLPDGPGWEALARIRSLPNHRNIPAVVISAVEPSDLEAPVEVQGFLTKPVRPNQLLGALNRAGVPMTILETANA